MHPIDEDTCAAIFGMLDDYVDRELTEEELARVERHLVSCAICAAEFRFEGALLRQLRSRVARVAAPPDLLARVWRTVTDRSRELPDGSGH